MKATLTVRRDRVGCESFDEACARLDEDEFPSTKSPARCAICALDWPGLEIKMEARVGIEPAYAALQAAA